jgi:ParE toxin of type II toxin-antitoxin system, parDE
MSYQISFTPEANVDFSESTVWYRQQRKSLETLFYQAVNKSIDIVSERPFLFAIRFKGVRVAPVKNFPFSIFYLVEEVRQMVVIVAILHNARNPEIWQART